MAARKAPCYTAKMRQLTLFALLGLLSPLARGADAGRGEFAGPRPVAILGWNDHAMEPFLARDGKTLFFNNSNADAAKTDIHYARFVSPGVFAYRGKVLGASEPGALDGVPTMTADGTFYFVSLRDYRYFWSLWKARWDGAKLSPPAPIATVRGRDTRRVYFDVEASADGSFLLTAEGSFVGGAAIPGYADLRVVAPYRGHLMIHPELQGWVAAVNTPDQLEYAACLSADGLELFFTRLDPKTLKSKLMVSRRASKDAPFGAPSRLTSVSDELLVEAPTLSPDAKTLYFHRKDRDGRHRLYSVSRP